MIGGGTHGHQRLAGSQIDDFTGDIIIIQRTSAGVQGRNADIVGAWSATTAGDTSHHCMDVVDFPWRNGRWH